MSVTTAPIFSGFQRQANARSVQASSKSRGGYRRKARHRSGRETDAGVHARQVASFKSEHHRRARSSAR
jgi:tRNA U38,U39,U40 pseudouridine synthase TruA